MGLEREVLSPVAGLEATLPSAEQPGNPNFGKVA